MIKVSKNAKLHFHWKVNPYDFSKEKENTLITKISEKYEVPKKNVKIIPEFIMVNNDGEKISIATDVIANIQNPEFQVKLFNEYLLANGIKDYDFELIKKIDSEINAKIDYEVYDKYKQYSIKWVKWKNFLSYGDDNFFDFTHLNGIVLLNGEPSNQSGKTTFAIDLLHFMLFGKTSKAATQEKIFNKHLPEATEVVVEGCINIEGSDYIIKRTLKRPSLAKRSSRSKTIQKVEYYRIVGGELEELEEYIDNQEEESSTKTNKVIKEAIGNESDFDMIICATSSNLDELIEKKETDRGRLLSKWIGLLPIEEKDELARTKFNTEVKPYLVSNKYNSEQLKQDNEQLEKNIVIYDESIKKLRLNISNIEKNIKEQEESINKFLQLKTKIDESLLRVDITTLNATLERLTNEGKKKGLEIDGINKRIDEIGEVNFSVTKYDELVEKKNELSSLIGGVKAKYNSQLKLIETIKKSEYCPTCGRRYDGVDNTEKLAQLDGELKELIKQGKELKEQLTSTDEILEKLKNDRDRFNELSRLTIKKSALEVNLEKLRGEYKDNKTLLNEYHKNNEAIDKNNKLDIEIRNLGVLVSTNRKSREESIIMIEKYEYDKTAAKNDIKARLDVIKQIEEEVVLIRNWRIYLDMVGKNGVSKMVLRKTLPIINAQMSYLLNDVCDFTVEITISDKNDIMFYLVKDGVYSDLTSGSGFERTASALALRIILGNISTLPRVNCLILDEIFGRVAEDNLDNMRSLLTKISDKYQYILQISHLNAIKDWSNEVITVSKEANISKVCIAAN